MPVFVGVDAGGTSTKVVAAREDASIGVFEADAANVRAAGIDIAADTIARAVRNALDGVAPDALFVGAAGVGRDAIAQALRHALEVRIPGAAIGISDDAQIALRAAVPQGDAVALIAGTGSIAYAHIGAATFRTGGYGYLLGDDGSGFAIGTAAVKLLLRSYDGRVPRDPMLERLEAALDANDAQTLIARIYEGNQPVRDLAALAPLVLAAASEGERSAGKIVQAAALELFELLKALVKRAGIGDRELPLVLSGGLFAGNSLLSFLVETRVSHDLPHLQPIKDAPQPKYGALALARALIPA